MRGYGQYCPVAKAAEVLGERWTLLIVRDVLSGAHRFTDLHRGLPGISRSLLTQRLRRLERDGLLERRHARGGRDEYFLTPLGEDLKNALLAIGAWADRNFLREPRREDLDPGVLMLWIERNVRRTALPTGRAVVRFEFPRAHPARYWLLFEDGVPQVCHDDPGFEPDLVVTADLRSLYLVYSGKTALAAALRDGSISLDGAPDQRRMFVHWFGRSPVLSAPAFSLAG